MTQTPVNERDIRSEVHRLKSLPRAADQEWPPLREELIRVLWAQSESSEHAKAIITAAIDAAPKFCPTPAALADIAGQTPAPGQIKPSADCEHCGGSGWVHSRRKVKLPGREEALYDYSAPCSCRDRGGA